jgi:YVTN family beta-propeller protein
MNLWLTKVSIMTSTRANLRKLTTLLSAILLFSFGAETPSIGEGTVAESKMVLTSTINGKISPKSVATSANGLISAHNMMYSHSVTIYDAATMKLVKSVSDSVSLAQFGVKGASGNYKGAPVEGDFSPDGKYLYVTNYAMYGKGFNKEGTDICSPSDGYDRSFLYRINLENYEIDAVYKVGSVPKVVKVTPDNKYILVSNWCSYDLHVISVETQKVVKVLKIGKYPRGIVVSKDSLSAYVAQMGGNVIHKINLTTFKDTHLPIGSNPRALVLSPDERYLYATLNASGQVVAFDVAKNKVVRRVVTGKATRSLALSTDGTALFVVNFFSNSISKVRTSDFKVLQNIKACNEPIGITYEPVHNRTWVACYGGSIKIYDNK